MDSEENIIVKSDGLKYTAHVTKICAESSESRLKLQN